MSALPGLVYHSPNIALYGDFLLSQAVFTLVIGYLLHEYKYACLKKKKMPSVIVIQWTSVKQLHVLDQFDNGWLCCFEEWSNFIMAKLWLEDKNLLPYFP